MKKSLYILLTSIVCQSSFGSNYLNEIHFKKSEKIHRVKFSPEEDIRLKELVNIHKKNWHIISEEMKDKNKRQCKNRWEYYLDPNLNTSQFSPYEDFLLMEKYNEFGKKWVTISKFFNNRTDGQIKIRFSHLFKNEIKATKSENLKKSTKVDDFLEIMSCDVHKKPTQEFDYKVSGFLEKILNNPIILENKSPIIKRQKNSL